MSRFNRFQFSLNHVALILVAGLYLSAVIYRFQVREEMEPEGYEVLRIAHKRLEPGYRDALDLVIRDFEEMKRRQGEPVKVHQITVSQHLYEPWLNTQLVGGTVPDIVQMPETKVQAPADWIERFFFSLDEMTAVPNPWNDFDFLLQLADDLDLHRNVPPKLAAQDASLGEPLTLAERIGELSAGERALLEKSSHMQSFFDGMLGGYNYAARKHFTFTTIASQQRVFYNKELLKKATGSEVPPDSLGEFFATCEALRRLKSPEGRAIIPIAATRTVPEQVLIDRYQTPFTFFAYHPFDRHLVGDTRDSYWLLQAGKLSLDLPEILAFYEFCREFVSYCTPGFQAVDHDNATFQFVQGRAAMRITGVENAAGLFEQCPFPIGIMSFPLPAPGEKYAGFARYDVRESNRSGGQFGLTRQTKNLRLAQDFMRFWTSMVWNERFNRFAQLVPVIKGADPAPRLEPFRPTRTGISGASGVPSFNQGGNPLWNEYLTEFWRYLSGELDYDAFIAAIRKRFFDPQFGIDRQWFNQWDQEQRLRRIRNNDYQALAAKQILYDRYSEDDQRRLNFQLYSVVPQPLSTHPLQFDLINRENPRPFPEY